jgi:hypothetical protein
MCVFNFPPVLLFIVVVLVEGGGSLEGLVFWVGLALMIRECFVRGYLLFSSFFVVEPSRESLPGFFEGLGSFDLRRNILMLKF